MLQHGEDVWEGGGVACEGSECGSGEMMQLLPAVTASVDKQCSEVLCGLGRVVASGSGNGIGDAELGVAAACVTVR